MNEDKQPVKGDREEDREEDREKDREIRPRKKTAKVSRKFDLNKPRREDG